MVDYLNPSSIQFDPKMGLSSGAATESLVFAAALALDLTTMKRNVDAVTIADEVRIVFQNLDDILGEAGLSRRDIVKTTCYLRNDEDRFDFIAAYKEQIGAGPFPARCTLTVGLASDVRVQIEAIAVR